MAVKKSDILDILKGVEVSIGNKKKPRLIMGNQMPDAELVSFGVPSIDSASNSGGHPRGSIIELYGPESSGKSYVAYKMIASYQALGMNAALLDVEGSFWPTWVAASGVDISKIVIGQTFDSGEQTMMYAEKLAETKAFGIIVIDSIAALLPKNEAVQDMDGKTLVGAHAAMMSRCLRRLHGVVTRTETTLVCINQTRSKIGVMFGNPETTPGGAALKFYSAMRIGLQHIGIEKGDVEGIEGPIGIRTRVKFIKNKVGQPFGADEFCIYHVEGIDTPMVKLVNLAIRLRISPGRKSFDDRDPDNKTFSWKDTDGDIINTECSTASDLAEWFEANNLVQDVVQKIVVKAAAKAIDVPPEVLALGVKTEEVQEQSDQSEKDGGVEKKKV